jgi:hypothetical protein
VKVVGIIGKRGVERVGGNGGDGDTCKVLLSVLVLVPTMFILL